MNREGRKRFPTTLNARLHRYDLPPDCSLPQFLQMIEKAVAGIPKDERGNIDVEFEDGNDEESSCLYFVLYRDETDGEFAKRVQREAARARDVALAQHEEEKALFVRLKKKYEGPS